MRRDCSSLLAVISASILLLQVSCQQKAKVPETGQKEADIAPPAGKQAPKITFEKVVHEFGEVSTGKKYTAEFKFTNTGGSPLKITGVKKCCGVVTKLGKEEFAPGESGVLKVEYNSSTNASLMRRKLYVSSNDEENPKVELTLQAKVVPKVEYEPQKLNLVLKEENADCPNITIKSADKQPFSIKAFKSTGESITLDIDPSVEATEFVLKPKVDLEKLQRRPVGFINIDLTHPECSRIFLSFNTRLRFEFEPRSIIIFNPEPQKPIVKKLSMVSNYDEEFEVESTSSQIGFTRVLSQEKTAEGYQFEVEVTPPAPDDTGKFTDVLYVNLKGGEKLAINCYVRYLKKQK